MRRDLNTKSHKISYVVEQLGISERSVYRLFDSGDLTKIIVGKRSARVTDESLQAYFRRLKDAA